MLGPSGLQLQLQLLDEILASVQLGLEALPLLGVDPLLERPLPAVEQSGDQLTRVERRHGSDIASWLVGTDVDQCAGPPVVALGLGSELLRGRRDDLVGPRGGELCRGRHGRGLRGCGCDGRGLQMRGRRRGLLLRGRLLRRADDIDALTLVDPLVIQSAQVAAVALRAVVHGALDAEITESHEKMDAVRAILTT